MCFHETLNLLQETQVKKKFSQYKNFKRSYYPPIELLFAEFRIHITTIKLLYNFTQIKALTTIHFEMDSILKLDSKIIKIDLNIF